MVNMNNMNPFRSDDARDIEDFYFGDPKPFQPEDNSKYQDDEE
jgi:hypothetical protein